jgi:predicted enzyme related to lactoylglutathione lyase
MIGWVELLAGNLDASTEFYRNVFGWKIEGWAPGYQVFETDGESPAGGLRGNAPDGTPSCVVYIYVPDVAAAQAQIEAAGGRKLTEPENIGSGMIGHFADPGGTIYGLADIKQEIGYIPVPLGGNPPAVENTICCVELYGGPDFAVTAKFFGDLFGWGTLETMPGYMSYDPGASVGGTFQSHTPGTRCLAYIYVADVAAKLAEIEAAGGKRMGDPMSMPGFGTFGYFTDPSGTPAGLIGP